MQINNQSSLSPSAILESSIELKEGAVYRASIKERVSDHEAILQIRGKEQLARFEDGVPASGNRVTIQVNEKNDGIINVKTIEAESAKPLGSSQVSNEEAVLKSLGLTGKESSSLKQAVQILLDKGSPLSKETVQDVKEFMDKANGTIESKIETVKALANKRLEPTQPQLRAIHEALHGKPLNELLTNIAKEIDPDFKLESNDTKLQAKANTILNPVETEKPAQVQESISENIKSKNSAISNQLSELVRKSREMVEKEPDLKKAIQQIKEEIIKNPKMDRKLAQKVEKAATEAEKLQTVGRDRLLQALKSAEEQLIRKEQQQAQASVSTTQKTGTLPITKEGNLASLVSELQNEVSKSPNLPKSIEQIKELIVENPRFSKEIADKASQAVKEAVILAKQGRMTTGKEVLNRALANIAEAVERANVDSRPSDVVKEVKAEVQRDPDLLRVIEKVRDQVVNNPKIDREVAQKVEQALKEANQLQQIGKESIGRERLQQVLAKAEVELKQLESRQPVQQAQPERVTNEQRPSEVVKNVKVEIQREPELQKAIEKVRDQVVNNPKIDREVAQKVDQALKEANQLQQIGKESVGREHLQQVLAKAEVELKQLESRQPVQQAQSERVTNEQRPSEVVKDAKAEIQREPDLQKVIEKVREQVVNNPKIDREVAQKVDQALKEANQLQQIGKEDRLQQVLAKAEVELRQLESRQPVQQAQPERVTNEQRPSEVVKDVKAEIQREPDLQKVIEKVRDQVVNNPKIDREVAQKVEQALKEANQLQKIGKESVGRDHLQQVLAKAEVELKQLESRQPVQQVQPERVSNEQRPSDVVKDVKAEIQREPDLQKAIEKVGDQVVNNPKIDREVAQKVEQVLKEANQLQQIGKETIGRDRLQQVLAKAEVELKLLELRQPVQQTHPDQNINEPRPSDSRQPSQTVPSQQATDIETESNFKQIENPLNQKTQISDTIQNLRTQIQTETDTNKVLQKVQELVVNNKEIDPEISKGIERLAKQANQLDQAGRERLIKMLQQVESALKQETPAEDGINTNKPEQPGSKIDQAFNNIKNSEAIEEVKPQGVKASESLNQALKLLQKEPNLEQALEQVRKEITSNPNVDLKTIERTEKAINQANQLLNRGREIAARQQMTKELTDLEQEITKSEPKAPQDSSQYDLDEQLQSLQIQSKDILVTKVTQKLAQATQDFRELKREISRSLDNVHRLVGTFKNNAYPQAKQMLETAISKLDNAILKSEMMLFTDMKTEKQLMQASSQLAEAKKLLAKGEHAQAGKIVSDVKNLIDKLIFKPSEQKIMHFVNKESMALENRSSAQQMLSQFGETTRGYTGQEASPRQMFEMVRSLGLNHDSDVAHSLVFNKGDQSQNEQQERNLKTVLMKLAQGEETKSKIAQQAEQALTNLTGQQLLSKSDASGTLQSMFFNLPMLLGGKPENLQVFVNSKNEGQQVDWQNCNLYFLLETKKLGDVGILLNSTDRNLSITIKNDRPGFKERMEPLADLTKEKLQEVGYNVSSLSFTRMTPIQAAAAQQIDPEAQEKPTRPVFTEKGMDFKI
ncbi:hypothetical protein [Bacillus sp. S/N-304-OC-R1]|uniref:hypothetical protein n=1 Tax=Bacillus sp. S/N-304-OC-R1 TaxID=2758034 RepID=UPI001C8E31A4|nr:hypothetical protein [Bacillus sp. S/N-304-OC-R1]MBY0123476.1 hypothetical protein [Bacillus sp. S/N-304-OC-R1]